MKLNNREKKMIATAIGVILIAVLYHYVVIPYWDNWNIMKTQTVQLQAKLNRAHYLKAHPQTGTYSRTTIENQTVVIAGFLEDIEKWAEAAGVQIGGIRPSSSISKGVVTELSFDIEITGDLGGICRFIESVEKPSILARINKMRLTKPKDNSGDMTASITISTLAISDTPAASPRKAVSKG